MKKNIIMKINTRQERKEQNAITIILAVIAAVCIAVTLLR
jgi:hypothetical protein